MTKIITAGAINIYGLKIDFWDNFLVFFFEAKSKAKFDKWKYKKHIVVPKRT